jgi:hypothetical protein
LPKAGYRQNEIKTGTRQANRRRTEPDKYEAHLAVQRAVKAGELAKDRCEVCGGSSVDAHMINTTSG